MTIGRMFSRVPKISLTCLFMIPVCSALSVPIAQPSSADDDLSTASTDALLNTTLMSTADVHVVDSNDFPYNSTLADLASRLALFNVSQDTGNTSADGDPGIYAPIDPRKRVVRCFKESDPRVNPTTLDACHFSQEFVLRRDLTEHNIRPDAWQRWHYEPAPRGYHEVPEMWVALHPKKYPEDHSCRVIVSTHKYQETDVFRTVDVVVGIQKLMDTCLSPSKGGWGGLTTLGQTGDFFVAIDGYAPPRTTTSSGALVAEKTAVPETS